MPIVADPHPACISYSIVPSTIGARPDWTSIAVLPSISSSKASRLRRGIRVSQATRPSALEPAVTCSTQPSESVFDPYSPVEAWPIASPSHHTVAVSSPRCQSVSIFIFVPQ